jgi:hypothetical protein
MSHPQFDAAGKPIPHDPDGGEFAPPVYYAEPPKKPRGCFFYGCIFAAVGMGLALLVFVALIGTSVYFINQALNEYTSPTPAEIPQVNLSEEQKKELKERWSAFKKAVEEDKDAEIVLTADEINALIEEEPQLKGKVFIKLKGDEAIGEVSIPLDVPGKGKRYINGTGTITAELTDGNLDVRIHELEVNGKKLPPEVKAKLGGENIAKDFTRNPENAKLIRKFESIKLKDSKVYIKAKGKGKGEGEAGKDTTTTKPAAEGDKPSEPPATPPKAEAPKTSEPKPEPPKSETKGAEEKPKGQASIGRAGYRLVLAA